MDKRTAFVEGYGCSLNRAETDQLRGFLLKNNFGLADSPAEADLIIVSACAVKTATEHRMLKRIKELNLIAKDKGSQIIVSGCLPKICPKAVEEISPRIKLLGTSLAEISESLGLPKQEFGPGISEERSNEFVSIIPIALGCLGNCSFCCVKNARGSLKSYPPNDLNRKFKNAIRQTREVWLTAQDTGCYGFDIETSLPSLLRLLLSNEGNFRIRIGMMNPEHLEKIVDDLLPLFDDKRLYRFFHIPLQSASSRILKLMKRGCTKQRYIELIGKIRAKLPEASISTDIIAGFPTETEEEFNETLEFLGELKPDVVNISRFGVRPNTAAAELNAFHGRVLKRRSRAATELCRKLSFKKNKAFMGTKQRILVTEKGKKGNFVGRTLNYKPVVIEQNALGRFMDVRIAAAGANYLVGEAIG